MHPTIPKVDFLATLFENVLSPYLVFLALNLLFPMSWKKNIQGDELFAREQASTNYSSWSWAFVSSSVQYHNSFTFKVFAFSQMQITQYSLFNLRIWFFIKFLKPVTVYNICFDQDFRNILRDDSGHLKVADFGVSKLLTVKEDKPSTSSDTTRESYHEFWLQFFF